MPRSVRLSLDRVITLSAESLSCRQHRLVGEIFARFFVQLLVDSPSSTGILERKCQLRVVPLGTHVAKRAPHGWPVTLPSFGKVIILNALAGSTVATILERGALVHLALRNNGLPQAVTIDKSGANTAGIESYNASMTRRATQQCKYLNTIVDQDHRAVKRITRPMVGFKSFRCARIMLGGIEIMHMIRKRQLRSNDGSSLSAAQQFSSLTAA